MIRRSTSALLVALLLATLVPARADDLPTMVERASTRMVKLYGAGGFRGLESYQSGFMVSADGVVVTAWSYVLDTDEVTAVTADGRRFTARLLGADPRTELAVLKFDADGLPHFDLAQVAAVAPGDRVVALSNLFGVAAGDEPVSAQAGVVAATTRLDARRGAFETPYTGPILVLDLIANNPGAAGGALVDRSGNLVGMLGKELRHARNGSWLNYAVPYGELAATVAEIRAGRFSPRRAEDPAKRPEKPWTANLAGLLLVPDVLEKTPPFIDAVRPGSPAAAARLAPDDLLIFVNDQLVPSIRALRDELSYVDRDDPLRLVVMRGQTLVNVELAPPVETPPSTPSPAPSETPRP